MPGARHSAGAHHSRQRHRHLTPHRPRHFGSAARGGLVWFSYGGCWGVGGHDGHACAKSKRVRTDTMKNGFQVIDSDLHVIEMGDVSSDLLTRGPLGYARSAKSA